MEDNKNEFGNSEGWRKCQEMCCHRGHGHRHFLLRWLLGLFALMLAFWLGVKIGEFKGAFGGGYGYSGYGYGGMMRGYPNMMYGNNLQYYPGVYTLPPTTRATTTPQK